MVLTADSNQKPDFDPLLRQIADYTLTAKIESPEAWETAHLCLLDTIGCGLLALNYSECTKLLGPIVPGVDCKPGARVFGTPYELDPVQAAFNIGTMIRWLDFNDTWLAAEWGHPSDNLGAILAISDYLCRTQQQALTMRDVLAAMIQAHEIQGVLALENSFNRVGLDHVVLVKVASTAVTAKLLGLSREQLLNALSLAWVDGQSLRTYRHAPNTGSRKSWAAGDATSRAVRLCLIAATGEMGYPSVLSAPTWGFQDVLFTGKPLQLAREFGTYVMENVLFKISYPAEFHAQTAVEAAIQCHSDVIERIEDIDRIELVTHESAMRIINKTGPLHNPADRDHCLQYMVAIGLLYGGLTADHYENDIAADPRIDALREKMHVTEDTAFSQDYLDPDKRAISNQIKVVFADGSSIGPIRIDYPLGHRRRRQAGVPVLLEKFKRNCATRFSQVRTREIVNLCQDYERLLKMPVNAFIDQIIV